MKRGITILVAIVLAGATQVHAMGYGPFPAFAGVRLPRTGSVFAGVAIGQYGFGPYKMGFYLDASGDSTADVADVANPLGVSAGIGSLLGAYVSPSDPSVVYMLYEPASGGAFTIVAMRRVGDGWMRIGSPMPYPVELREYATGSWNVVKARLYFPQFISSWTNIVSVRRMASGSDALLVTASRVIGGQFFSRYALLVDTAGQDGIADQWRSTEELPQIEAMTLDEAGGVLARHSDLHFPTDGTDRFVRIMPRDDDGDGVPETPNSIDPTSGVMVDFTGAAAGCWADIDYGTGRFFFGPFMGTVNLNSYGSPIHGTIRPFENLTIGIVPFESDQILLDPSGAPFAVGVDPQGDRGVIRWVDADFDGLVNNRAGLPFEAFPAFYENALPDPFLINASIAKPDRVPLEHGAAALRFANFGDYGGGRAFTFRFGSQEYDSVWVSATGLVSFVGPVSGASTASGLEQMRAVIALAFANAWDTTEARVYAGYSPAEASFRDGAPVYAFAIEWRGLRDPNWEAGRSFSMRLLLYSDGTFRTDYGAIDEVSTPFVVGYSGPGSTESAVVANPALHSWGSAPAGTGLERVATGEYGAANEFGHIESRWLGYPDRLEGPAPVPVVANLKLKKGKLTFSAAGSNVEPGARLVVGGSEAFELKKNRAGTKWVVPKKAHSYPGGVSIATALSQGGIVVVVNPDASVSEATQF